MNSSPKEDVWLLVHSQRIMNIGWDSGRQSLGPRNKLELNKQLREATNHVPPKVCLLQLGEHEHLLQTLKLCFLFCFWAFPPVKALHEVGSWFGCYLSSLFLFIFSLRTNAHVRCIHQSPAGQPWQDIFLSKGQMRDFPYLLWVFFSFFYCSCIYGSMHIVKSIICSMCALSHCNSEIENSQIL